MFGISDVTTENKALNFLFESIILFQLASIPQLIPGTQFPYSFSGQPIPGYYIPQPIAQVRRLAYKLNEQKYKNFINFQAAAQAAQQTSYLQGLPAGYQAAALGNFGVSSYPQNYIG